MTGGTVSFKRISYKNKQFKKKNIANASMLKESDVCFYILSKSDQAGKNKNNRRTHYQQPTADILQPNITYKQTFLCSFFLLIRKKWEE